MDPRGGFETGGLNGWSNYSSILIDPDMEAFNMNFQPTSYRRMGNRRAQDGKDEPV